MTSEEMEELKGLAASMGLYDDKKPCKRAVILGKAIKALAQEPCEMTAEEYRQRMIQAFHNADCDELIAICVLPTEKEFEHLEWLLKNHYKQEPCGNAIDRAEAIKIASGYCHPANVAKELAKLPPVTPQPKTGHWGKDGECPFCGYLRQWDDDNFCGHCGARMS